VFAGWHGCAVTLCPWRNNLPFHKLSPTAFFPRVTAAVTTLVTTTVTHVQEKAHAMAGYSKIEELRES